MTNKYITLAMRYIIKTGNVVNATGTLLVDRNCSSGIKQAQFASGTPVERPVLARGTAA